MVNATVGIGGADVDTWLHEEAPEVFDYDYAAEALENYSEDIAAVGLARDRFRRMLMDKGYHSVQIRVDNTRLKYVYFHPDKTENNTPNLRKLFNNII